MPHVSAAHLPLVVDTLYFMQTGQRLDLTGPGPWELTGFGDPDITTTHDGPIDYVARQLLASAYPSVITWQARPNRVDETYHDSVKARARVAALLGIPDEVAHAVLTIAATDELGCKFVHGQWEITGDDDDQSFRIRSVDADTGRTIAAPSPVWDKAAPFPVWMVCNACGGSAVPAPGTGDPARGMAGRRWQHLSDGTRSCHGEMITVRVDA